MKPELQRIKIAEACGWIRQSPDAYIFESPVAGSQEHLDDLPDYLDDLNAMHEAEKFIETDSSDLYKYASILAKNAAPRVTYGEYSFADVFNLAHATAAQRAEAFLRTLNLWQE